MKFKELKIKGSYEIELTLNEDERGHFSRLYCIEEYKKNGIDVEWKQINLSKSKYKGQVRGMHYYKSGFGEYKMIKCVKGEIFDVIVDMRPNSDTYLNYESVILNDTNNKLLLIPPGCAHGFQTLTDDVEMIYFHSEIYKSDIDLGVHYLDSQVNVKWPLPPQKVSIKDSNLPYSNDL